MQKILYNNINKFTTFNKFFIKQVEYITIDDLNKIINIKNIDELDGNLKIYNVTTLDKATENDISFLSNLKYVDKLKNTSAGFCFLDENHKKYINSKTLPIVVNDPHYSYCKLLEYLYFVPIYLVEDKISEKAYIDKTAKIGKNVEIQAGVFIDKNVVIGDNCKICANAVINHDCIIGNNTYIGANATISYAEIGHDTIIHNGAAIGQCGFGFAHNNGFNYKVTQLGTVKIGNFVEIGANTCIDRGAFDDTVIGDNTKIDNLVQIAHGVKIGQGCFFASQVGISGSTKVGNFVQLGGQVGLAGHITIGDMAEVAAQGGVMKDIEPKAKMAGSPAMPIRDWHRSTVLIKKLINNKGE